MYLRLRVVWLTLMACGRPGDRVSDVPIRTGAAAAIDASAPSVVPTVDLGPGFEPLGFVPGRYAVLVERNQAGVHARNHLTHRSRASLVLELGGDGRATACHGWQAATLIDRPDGQQVHEFQVQQGFLGTHVVRSGEVEITLSADDSICAEVRRGQAPARRATMTLRCVLARARGHATLTEPVLLCEWREADWAAYYPLTLDGVVPERWVVLGGGNGVRARITGKTISSQGAPVRVLLENSVERIEPNEWDRPLPLPEPADEL